MLVLKFNGGCLMLVGEIIVKSTYKTQSVPRVKVNVI